MSGVVSGSQMNFIPHASPIATPADNGDSKAAFGVAGREFRGPRSLAPLARGAFSSQDKALAFRHSGDETLSHGAKNIGSWLFKSE